MLSMRPLDLLRDPSLNLTDGMTSRRILYREIVWFGALVLAALTLAWLISTYREGEYLDIQIHDTYVAMPAHPLFLGLVILAILLLLKCLVQGIMLLVNLNLYIAATVALLLLAGLSILLFAVVFMYQSLTTLAVGPAPGTEYYYELHRSHRIGLIFYSLLSTGVVRMLIAVVINIKNKIRLLSDSKP